MPLCRASPVPVLRGGFIAEQRQILYYGSFANGWRDLAGSSNSQYPALNKRCFALSRRESGSQETRKCTVKVRAGHPFRSGKCVMLMIVPILPRDWSRCLPVSGSRAVRCKSSSAPFARTTAVTRCDFPHLCLGDLLPEPGFFVPSSAILVPGNRAKM